jgi:hypothetical protein
VASHTLESLRKGDEITHFYRPAEKRWGSIKFDSVRERGAYTRDQSEEGLLPSHIGKWKRSDLQSG